MLWYRAQLRFESGDVAESGVDFQRARDTWEQVLQSDPVPQHHYELARFYLNCSAPELRNASKALEHVQACAESIPTNPLFRKLLSEAKAVDGGK